MNKVGKPLSNNKQKKVNNNILNIYFYKIQFKISENDDSPKLLGKKRYKENNGNLFSINTINSNNNKNNVVFFNFKAKNNTEKISLDELINLYNMKKLINFQCFKTTNHKYENNEFIPSLSFL